jgi:hypothetical protein
MRSDMSDEEPVEIPARVSVYRTRHFFGIVIAAFAASASLLNALKATTLSSHEAGFLGMFYFATIFWWLAATCIFAFVWGFIVWLFGFLIPAINAE